MYPAGVSGATGTCYFWGAQLTATASPVPYVPTTSAAVTRNADAFALIGTDLTDNFNPLEGTMFASGIAPVAATTGYVLLQISDNSYNNRHVIYYDAPAQAMFAVTAVGGVTQAGPYVALARGAAFRLAYSYKANAFSFSVNGAAAVTDNSGNLPTGLDRLHIGSDHNIAANWGSYIDRVFYKTKAASAADVQKMAA